MEDRSLRNIGITFSVISGIALIPAIGMQFFSIFLFDGGKSVLAFLISLGILLIPVSIIAGNMAMWNAIKVGNGKRMAYAIAIPILYPVFFFVAWNFLG